MDGSVWVILPTYDEAENLEAIVGAARERLPADRRVLVVDDNSPDGSGEIADRLAAADDDVAVLHRPLKQGLGPAYVAGFRQALDGGAVRRPYRLLQLTELALGAQAILVGRDPCRSDVRLATRIGAEIPLETEETGADERRREDLRVGVLDTPPA